MVWRVRGSLVLRASVRGFGLIGLEGFRALGLNGLADTLRVQGFGFRISLFDLFCIQPASAWESYTA